MKIQNINNYINYNNNKKSVKHEEITKNKNFDVIEINKNNSNKDNEKGSIDYEKIKNNIVTDINKQTSSEKIDSIKKSIDNKTYQINVDEIVRILLDK